MSRRLLLKKKFSKQDLKFSEQDLKLNLTKYFLNNHFLATLFINRILKAGKKNLAKKLFLDTLDIIKKRGYTEKQSILLIEKAVRNASPKVALKVVIVEDNIQKIPITVSKLRSTTIAISWIINCSKKQTDRGQASKLASELIDTSKRVGETIKKKIHLYKMVEASKAFTESQFESMKNNKLGRYRFILW